MNDKCERFVPPSPELVKRVRAFAERELTAEERDAWSKVPATESEREDFLSLHRWFVRRYPTPAERLAYARRAYSRWKGAMPEGGQR